MLAAIPTVLALTLLSPAAIELNHDIQLSYRGSMTSVRDDGTPAKKEFELRALIEWGAEAPNVATAFWALEESGRGGWPWYDRFGKWTIDPSKRDDGSTGPSLLYERAEGKSVVPLPQLFFKTEQPLEAGAQWNEGRLEYRVRGTGEKGTGEKADRECWEIEARTAYGHKRTLWVDKDSSLVVAVRETVFIGQGEQHELKIELVSASDEVDRHLRGNRDVCRNWVNMRHQLNHKFRSHTTQLSAEQVAVLREKLPTLAAAKELGDTPLALIAPAALKDLQAQKERAATSVAQRDGILQKPLGEFELADSTGKTLTNRDLIGKVTVLHFWDYRDTPLEEPYGQVGYLDFLIRNRGPAGAQVIGVNVSEKLADEETRRGAIAAARRFKAFMNLQYNVLWDDGALLKLVGDPRVGGGKLPLFVVIDRHGNVIEHHAGLYDIRPDRGLAELDAIVAEALEKK